MNRCNRTTFRGIGGAARRPLHGFTLVELLVVIGIIAVLVSILLPTISKARMQAINAKCLSNLRDMGHSLQMYANEYKDKVPIGQSSIVRDSHYFCVSTASTTDPIYVCAGPTYVAGHVKDARSWYCPSPNIVDERWMYDSALNPWPPAPVTNPQVRMGYYLRPGFSWGGGSALGVPPKLIAHAPSTAKIWPNPWPQMTKFKSKAIVADLWPIPQGSVAKDSPHGRTMNVLFGDRSVQIIRIDGDLKTKVEYLQLDTNYQHVWDDYLSEVPVAPTNLKGLWIIFDAERT